MTDAIIRAIGLPFDEAIDHLQAKALLPASRDHASWTEVWGPAHAKAFTVAGAASEALLADFQKEIAKAIKNGTTLEAWRPTYDDIVKRHGWQQRHEPGWRAKIIYETNMATAHAAGRYAQMTDPDVLEAYPFWRYVHSGSRHPRLQHLNWNGLTLRADDAWWNIHYPPNGWHCGCRVRPVSEPALRRSGRSGPDVAPDNTYRPWTDKATGQVRMVPNGIDPGWDYNVGKAWKEGAPPVAPPAVPASPPDPRPAKPKPPPPPPPPSPEELRRRRLEAVVHGKPADEAAYHMPAWNNASDVVLNCIRKRSPLSGVLADTDPQSTGWFSVRGSDCKIGMPTHANEGRRRVLWRHEYGHAIDQAAATPAQAANHLYASAEARPHRVAEADALVARSQTYQAGPQRTAAQERVWRRRILRQHKITEEQLEAYTDRVPLRAERVLRVLDTGTIHTDDIRMVARCPQGATVLDADWERNTLADFLGALTNNRIGWGHSDDYYRRAALWHGEEKEMFANYVALISGEGKEVYDAILRRLAPRSCAAFGDILERYGKP